jgi:hypothetical protein
MFGLPGIPKILIIAAIVVVVWYFFRRRAQLRKGSGGQASPESRRHKPPTGAKGAHREVEDMAQCKVCGAYVAAKGASSCGRPDCPY